MITAFRFLGEVYGAQAILAYVMSCFRLLVD